MVNLAEHFGNVQTIMMKLKRVPGLIAILALIAIQSNATTLYVRYTSTEIIIATDSKRTAETGETVCVCKIFLIGDTVIASAGLAEYGAFDPRNFAREAIRNSPSLVDARAKFEDLISEPLIEVLKRLKKRNSERYEVFKKGAETRTSYYSPGSQGWAGRVNYA
jgi:hypothetical protein